MSNEENIKRYEYIIDGNEFNNMDEFYKYVDKTFSDGEEPCRNLDAFIDFLRGGFGKHNYNEPIKITWVNNEKSKKDLGYPEIINVLKKRLVKCHPSNKDKIQKEIEMAEKNEGKTIYDEIIECINDLNNDGFNCLLVIKD